MTSIRSIDQWITPLEEKIQPMLQRLAGMPAHYWLKLVMAVLVLWIISTSVFFIALFLSDDSPATIKTGADNTSVTTEAVVNIDNMVKWHLFGESNAAATQTTVTVNPDDDSKNAGKTRLPIQLLGLMYASDQKQARAILFINNEEKQYKVNDTLPVSGNATLHKVLVDRIIVNNNGNMEALWLFDPDRPGIAKRTIPTPQLPAIDTPEQPVEEPSQNGPLAESAVQIVPAWGNNGKLQGYRINRGANSAAFDALGFSDGDIVTKINGVQMNNPQNAIQLYQQMQRGGQASFEVIRDGQSFSFQTALTPNNLLSPDQSGGDAPEEMAADIPEDAPEETPDESSTPDGNE